ncbi:MAG: phage terminase large subunit [Methylobacter sp.]
MSAVQVTIPDKLIPVFLGDADVRGSWGGRGSAKTRSFAKMVAVKGYIFGNAGIKGQLLCARQFMNSLDDSSLEECKRAIQDEPFLMDYYEIGDRYIKSKDGNIAFSFAGLDRNIASVKSKGRILLCWVDEAESVNDIAWKTLIPTLREEGDGWNAELWVTWNPLRKGSPTDLRFKNSTDPRYKIVALNWRDNPKFPAVLERQRQRDLIERPQEYDHIWEGAYGSAQGAILARWVSEAERDGRISDNIVYDPKGAGIVVSGDLGFRDTCGWWYWQPVLGGAHVLKYDADHGLDVDDWVPRIQTNLEELGCKSVENIGKIWLPHDAKVKTFQSKHSSQHKFMLAFGNNKIRIVPQSRKSDQIEAARSYIKKCAFNQTLCETGLDGLRAWEYEYNEDAGIFSREPKHNWASHPSDGFAYGCQVLKEPDPDDIKLPIEQQLISHSVQNVSMGSLTRQHLQKMKQKRQDN